MNCARRLVSYRPWHFGLVPVVLAGCGRHESRTTVDPSPCSSTATGAPFDSTQMPQLAGRYQLTMVTEAIDQPGATVTGSLELVWVSDHGIETLVDARTGRRIHTAGPFCARREPVS